MGKIEGLPIQKEWVVIAVKEGDEEPGQHGGTLKKFYVDFEGAPDVYWRRKMPATVDIGKSYFGTVSEGKHGPIFKKESPGRSGGESSSGGARGSSSGSGRSYKPESEFDPEKVARMGRAHAQDMALRALELEGGAPDDLDDFRQAIVEWTDFFEADVSAAGAAAKGAAAQTSEPAPAEESAPPPSSDEPPPPPVDETTIRNLCEHAGLDSVAANALTGFICGKLNDEQKQRARTGLERNTADTLSKLREAYEENEDQALPEDDDDIPF